MNRESSASPLTHRDQQRIPLPLIALRAPEQYLPACSRARLWFTGKGATCLNKRSGQPVNTAGMCLPSFGQVYLIISVS